MKTLSRPQSMLSSINNSTKHNDIAYQYIQTDIDKMNAIAMDIEKTANKLIPLVPPNLQNDISSLKKQSQQVSHIYSSFNFNAYKNKLKMVKDSLNNLNQKVLLHVSNDPEFIPTRSYAESFYNDVKTRILNTTKQQCSNLEFCIDSELRSLANKSQTSSPFLTEIPHFDTPSPKVVFYKKKAPSNENEKIILTIKDQTERLSEIYSRMTELRTLQKKQEVFNDTNNNIHLPSLLKMQEEDMQNISELEMRYNVLNMKSKSILKASKKIDDNDSNSKEEVVMKEQLDSFEKLSDTMIQTAKKKFEEVKSKVKIEIQMIRSRLDILEKRINEYGDFSGETNDMLTYLGMKVDEVVNADENQLASTDLNEDQKNEDLANIYLDVRTRIAKSLIESQIESVKRSIRYHQFNKPLISTD